MTEYAEAVRREVHRLFEAHGYDGSLLAVDDTTDETIFLVAPGAAAALDEPALSTALQALLGRKVWVVDATPVWTARAAPFE